MTTMNATIQVLGVNVPVVHYPINWSDRVTQSFVFSTRIHLSGLREEQRGTTMQEAEIRNQLQVTYLGDGRLDSVRIYNRLAGLRGKPAVIPWLPEPLEDDVDRQGDSFFDPKNMTLEQIKVVTDQLIRIDMADPSVIEVQKAVSFDPVSQRINVQYPWQHVIPAHRQVFFFGRGVVLSDLSREFVTDQAHEISVRWRSHDDGLLP